MADREDLDNARNLLRSIIDPYNEMNPEEKAENDRLAFQTLAELAADPLESPVADPIMNARSVVAALAAGREMFLDEGTGGCEPRLRSTSPRKSSPRESIASASSHMRRSMASEGHEDLDNAKALLNQMREEKAKRLRSSAASRSVSPFRKSSGQSSLPVVDTSVSPLLFNITPTEAMPSMSSTAPCGTFSSEATLLPSDAEALRLLRLPESEVDQESPHIQSKNGCSWGSNADADLADVTQSHFLGADARGSAVLQSDAPVFGAREWGALDVTVALRSNASSFEAQESEALNVTAVLHSRAHVVRAQESGAVDSSASSRSTSPAAEARESAAADIAATLQSNSSVIEAREPVFEAVEAREADTVAAPLGKAPKRRMSITESAAEQQIWSSSHQGVVEIAKAYGLPHKEDIETALATVPRGEELQRMIKRTTLRDKVADAFDCDASPRRWPPETIESPESTRFFGLGPRAVHRRYESPRADERPLDSPPRLDFGPREDPWRFDLHEREGRSPQRSPSPPRGPPTFESTWNDKKEDGAQSKNESTFIYGNLNFIEDNTKGHEESRSSCTSGRLQLNEEPQPHQQQRATIVSSLGHNSDFSHESHVPVNGGSLVTRFLMVARAQRGSMLRCWRLDLDIRGVGCVIYQDYRTFCRRHGLEKMANRIWSLLRPDGSGRPLELRDVAPVEAADVNAAAELLQNQYLNEVDRIWHAMNPQRRDYIVTHEFVDCLNALDFKGDAHALFKALDTSGSGQVWRHELEYLLLLPRSCMKRQQKYEAFHMTVWLHESVGPWEQGSVFAEWVREECGGVDGLMEQLSSRSVYAAPQLAHKLKSLGFKGGSHDVASRAAKLAGSQSRIGMDTIRALGDLALDGCFDSVTLTSLAVSSVASIRSSLLHTDHSRSEQSHVDTAATSMEFEDLVARVNEVRANTPQASVAWRAWSKVNGSGSRDPSKHDTASLGLFLAKVKAEGLSEVSSLKSSPSYSPSSPPRPAKKRSLASSKRLSVISDFAAPCSGSTGDKTKQKEQTKADLEEIARREALKILEEGWMKSVQTATMKNDSVSHHGRTYFSDMRSRKYANAQRAKMQHYKELAAQVEAERQAAAPLRSRLNSETKESLREDEGAQESPDHRGSMDIVSPDSEQVPSGTEGQEPQEPQEPQLELDEEPHVLMEDLVAAEEEQAPC